MDRAVNPIPLLWVCGPTGVGKSTVGWQLFCQIAQSSVRISYLDIDQLGMCYPAPAADPERHHIKARNLGAMVRTFQATGAQGVLVSGVVDEIHGLSDYVDQIPQTDLTLCRLRVDRDVLAARLRSRGQTSAHIGVALRESEILDRSDFGDLCIDTSGLTVPGTLQRVVDQTDGWPPLSQKPRSENDHVQTNLPKIPGTPGSILWLCGTTGVGKSAVGWRIFEQVRQTGMTAAFVDLEQIGFYQPRPEDDPDNHRIKAHNLAAMWQTFQQSGAKCLILVGPIDQLEAVQIYTESLLESDLTLCLLQAGPEQLRSRIRLRGLGLGPRLAGDELRGKSDTILRRIADQAIKEGEDLQRSGIGDLCVDTDNRTVEEVAQMILTEVKPARF